MVSATGQSEDVLAITRVVRVVVVMGQDLRRLQERVDRSVISEDVEAEPLEGPIWTFQGARAMALQAHDAVDLGDQIWMRRRRSLAGGWDVIGVEDVRLFMPQEQFEAESVFSGIPVEGVDKTEQPLISELSPVHPDLGPLGREMVRKETVGAEEGLRAEGVGCRLLGDSSEGQAD